MNLRSGTSYWQALDPHPFVGERLADDAKCEVAVIGGGVTGALVAHRLIAEGVDTILLDRREPGLGSTAASTGLLQYEIDTPLVDLIARIGEQCALHAYRRGLKAIDEIEELVAGLGKSCGFARRESLYFASRRWHYQQLKEEFDCRRNHGFDVEFLERAALAERSSIRAAGAILSRGDAQIDPYRFTQRLLSQAATRGLRAFGEAEVHSVDEDADGVLLGMAAARIRARRVVFATGYESRKYTRDDEGTLHSTFAVASEPLESSAGWPENALIWETARPYFYARRSQDGRAIVGGGDTSFSTDHQRDGLVERKTAALKRRFEQLFPELTFEPAYCWAGTFGESKDGLAYIGQPSDYRHAYFAIGYGGNGITFSAIAARLITDLIVGRSSADAEVFRFGR
jgi:glycine/D-amino acid oxidase-like deaminating enzyme